MDSASGEVPPDECELRLTLNDPSFSGAGAAASAGGSDGFWRASEGWSAMPCASAWSHQKSWTQTLALLRPGAAQISSGGGRGREQTRFSLTCWLMISALGSSFVSASKHGCTMYLPATPRRQGTKGVWVRVGVCVRGRERERGSEVRQGRVTQRTRQRKRGREREGGSGSREANRAMETRSEVRGARGREDARKDGEHDKKRERKKRKERPTARGRSAYLRKPSCEAGREVVSRLQFGEI